MKLKRIDSEIRTIELGYEEEKPLTDYETQVIERYVEIHSMHAGFERSRREYSSKIEALNAVTLATQARLDRTKTLLNELLSAAGVHGVTDDTLEDTLKKLQAKTDKYNASVRGLHDELATLNNSWNLVCTDFGNFYEDWDTTFETKLEEFSDFIDKLYANYQEYQLDVDLFWDDHEKFKGCLWETHQRVDTLHTRLQEALDNWDSLATSANLFYEFVDMQDKFRDINGPDMLN